MRFPEYPVIWLYNSIRAHTWTLLTCPHLPLDTQLCYKVPFPHWKLCLPNGRKAIYGVRFTLKYGWLAITFFISSTTDYFIEFSLARRGGSYLQFQHLGGWGWGSQVQGQPRIYNETVSKELGLNKVISEGSYYAYILGARQVKIFDIEKKI